MRVLNDDYLQCRGAVLGKCDVTHVVKFKEMEFEFTRWFVEQAKDALLGQDDHQATIKSLQTKLDAIKQRIRLTIDLLDSGLAVNEIKERLAKLDKEKASVESQIADLKAQQSSNAALPDTIQRLETLIDDSQTNQETRRKIAALVPSIVKDVRIDLSDRWFPSFEIHLVNGEVHKWAYDVREFAIDTKGKYHVTDGGYVGR